MKLVITGSIAYDYLMTFPGRITDQILPDKLDHISLSFLVDTMKKQQGGTGANIAYSLALLGEKPLLVGAAGQDFEPYRCFLDNAGVNTAGVVIFPEAFTASFFANTDQVGNQICSFYSGAMQFAGKVTLNASDVSSEDWVVISPNDPEAMLMLSDECRLMNVPFICDPGQQIARFSGDDLRRFIAQAKLLILNEYEYDLFLEKTGFQKSEILSVVEVLIITLGEKGAQIFYNDQIIEIPVARPKIISDPTGVGDAFRAGLIKGRCYGLSWETAGRMGSLAATYVLETEGPQSHHYDLGQFIDRYIQVFGESEGMDKLCK
ncbi:carbohydrate kinase family protein [bacterium]|nr:carbohydrate kinase family protein [bacterium]